MPPAPPDDAPSRDAAPNRPALRVDLSALGRNAEHLRARQAAELGAVVKADAYGLGAEAVSGHLARACGVRSFFVAYAQEGRAIHAALARRGAAPDAIYVLNGYDPCDASLYEGTTLRPVLNDAAQAAAWSERGGPCALGVDIGMNRLGLDPGEAAGLPGGTGLDPADVVLVVAHLSHTAQPAHPANAQQVARFETLVREARDRLPRARFSLSASGGIALPAAPSEALVRPGIALYGGAPDGDPASALEPVATLTAPVIQTRAVRAGETAGYDGRWRAARDSLLAVLAIGYADGVPRSAFPAGRVVLNGASCPVAGTVSMDLLIVDATEAGPVRTGDRAELFGASLPIDAAAAAAGTIAYELLTRVGGRVARRYAA